MSVTQVLNLVNQDYGFMLQWDLPLGELSISHVGGELYTVWWFIPGSEVITHDLPEDLVGLHKVVGNHAGRLGYKYRVAFVLLKIDNSLIWPQPFVWDGKRIMEMEKLGYCPGSYSH